MKKVILLIATVIVGCGGGSGGGAAPIPAPIPAPVSTDTVSNVTTCLKVDAGSGVSVYLQYQIVNYTSNDRFVICSVSLSAGQYSGQAVYKGGNVSGNNSYCSVTADLDAPTSGYWTFTSVAGVLKAVYTDAGSAHNGYTYTYAGGECVVN